MRTHEKTVARIAMVVLFIFSAATAIALAETLFVAGPADVVDEHKTLEKFEAAETQKLLARQSAVIAGSEGALLWAVSAADGRKLAERKLEAIPVFDGMIAAGNHVFCATSDGGIIALGSKR